MLTPRVDQRNFGVMLSNWRVVSINALVVDRMPSGNVLLNADGQEFVTPLDLPVQPGTRLQLEVQQVTLIGVTFGGVREERLTIWRGVVKPTQRGGGLVSLRRSVAASQPTCSALATQPNLRALVNQTCTVIMTSALASQVLQSSTLSAGLLSQAVAHGPVAGSLAGRSGSLRTNTKTQLIQLQRSIAEIVETVWAPKRSGVRNLDLTNAALANLNQQQLISMPQENAGQRWAFNLPLEWQVQLLIWR